MFADLSLLTLIQRVIAAVIIAGVHGLALAGIARWLGDRTPQYDGRLSLSPLKHLSVLGLLSALATRAGWIVPIDLDPAQMRFGRWGLVICVLASLVLLVVFGLLVLMLRLPLLGLISQRAAMYIIPSLQVLGEMAIFYALLNLIPLPPMTGAHLLRAARPEWGAMLMRHTQWFAIGIAVIMVITRGKWLDPLVPVIRGLVA